MGEAFETPRQTNDTDLIVGNAEGKRPLGSSRRKWEDNITRHTKETVCKNVDSMCHRT